MGQYRVQIYFKDRIENASNISVEDFAKLSQFRKSLGPRGVLYKLFKDDDQLRQEVRVNIQRPILEFLKECESRRTQSPRGVEQNTSSAASSTNFSNDETIEREEFGLLDQTEKAEKAIELCVNSIHQINALIEEIGTETDRQVAEMENKLISNASATDKKTFINHFAEFLKSKANSLEQEATVARENFSLFAGSIVLIAGFQKEAQASEEYKTGIATFLGVAETMLSTLATSRTSIAGFRNAVANIPRITIQFNQAKRLLLHTIDECLTFFDEVERGIFEITAKA